MMMFGYAEKDLEKVGFKDFDLFFINQCLNALEKEGLISLTDQHQFDFGKFIELVLTNHSAYSILLDLIYQAGIAKLVYKNVIDDSMSSHFNYLLLGMVSLKEKDYKDFDKLYPKKSLYQLLNSFYLLTFMHLDDQKVIYNLLHKSSTLERSGWVESGLKVSHKETIAEHMYQMHLLASLYLDEEMAKRVSELCLVHDLAEVVTGDIVSIKKTSHDEENEDLIAKAMFLSIIHFTPSHSTMMYDAWCEWFERKTDASRLAHDFDKIQLYYQLSSYKLVDPITFNDDYYNAWLRDEVKTETGLKILKDIVADNDKFKTIDFAKRYYK